MISHIRSDAFLTGLCGNLMNSKTEGNVYHFLFGAGRTFQSIRFRRIGTRIFAATGVVHVLEERLEIHPIFFERDEEISMNFKHRYKIIQLIDHMFAHSVTYVYNTKAVQDDPVISFVIHSCSLLVSLADYEFVEKSIRCHVEPPPQPPQEAPQTPSRDTDEDNTDGLPPSPPSSSTCNLLCCFNKN